MVAYLNIVFNHKSLRLMLPKNLQTLQKITEINQNIEFAILMTKNVMHVYFYWFNVIQILKCLHLHIENQLILTDIKQEQENQLSGHTPNMKHHFSHLNDKKSNIHLRMHSISDLAQLEFYHITY